MTRVHYLQHVSFEGLGSMEAWLLEHDHRISRSRLYAGDSLPGLDSFDWLIVMGGPMGIYDYNEHPWLSAEKELIKRAIAENKVVLGVCLGAQLIADVLNAAVTRNTQKEIGWFPLETTEEGRQSQIGALLAETDTAFHWHGDTFEIPVGAVHLARSEACENQAFLYGDRVLGLQFHLEITPAGAAALCRECAHELTPSSHVQRHQDILAVEERFTEANRMMGLILEALSETLASNA